MNKKLMNLLTHHRHLVWISVVVLVIAGLVWHHQVSPYHFRVVEPGVLYRSGWMNPENLDHMLKKHHIRTVVNLCIPDETTFVNNYKDERRICHENGVSILYLPMEGNTPPSQAQTIQWLNLLKSKESQPVLVHCAQGATRTAAMVAVYEMEFSGKSGRQVVRSIETFGHQLSDPKRQTIYDFIVNYQPCFSKI